jgi:hypothetical protein
MTSPLEKRSTGGAAARHIIDFFTGAQRDYAAQGVFSTAHADQAGLIGVSPGCRIRRSTHTPIMKWLEMSARYSACA